jgi:hypothetical protein
LPLGAKTPSPVITTLLSIVSNYRAKYLKI